MVRRTELHHFVAMLALVCLVGCGEWEAADELQQRLRCGMTPAEVDTVAEGLGAESFRPIEEPNEYTTHVLNQKRTFFEFYFGDDGLETVRQGASVGWTTGTSYEPRVNLCTGEVTDHVVLTLKGPQELAGAEIFVDGQPRLRLSSGPGYQRNIALSTGPHEILIAKEGYEPIVLHVEYGPETDTAEITLPAPKKRQQHDSPV